MSPTSSRTSRTSTLGSRFLDADERITIADLHRRGLSRRAIATRIGRSHSTVVRELRRNSDPTGDHAHRGLGGEYGAARAQQLATARRRRPRRSRLATDVELREHVQALMEKRWSPQQISHDLRGHFFDQRHRHLSAETIYQRFYATTSVLRRTQDTRRWRRYRRPRAGRQVRRALPLPSIEQRPAHVEQRLEVGHWEGDLIQGTANRSAIATLLERVTRTVMLVHLPLGKNAAALAAGLIAAFTALPAPLRRSLTWDQGTEMADYPQLAAALDLQVYFAHPHSPWERGSNENVNGLLERDYFPKGSDLSVHSAQRLSDVAAELNDRPRRTLGWAAPSALIAPHLVP